MAAARQNVQTRELFAEEAATIVDRQHHLTWLAPSREEGSAGLLLQPEAVGIFSGADADQPSVEPIVTIQGGRARGLILHKLLEEVLTGETPDDPISLKERARLLIGAFGQPVVDDPAQGLSPVELEACVSRTLLLPVIVELRPTLTPELPVYASVVADGLEQATAGIADATSLGADGKPRVVVDWKSDVDPSSETIEHYRAQVRAYLDLTGAERGLIVLLTSGKVLTVMPSVAPALAAG